MLCKMRHPYHSVHKKLNSTRSGRSPIATARFVLTSGVIISAIPLFLTGFYKNYQAGEQSGAIHRGRQMALVPAV